ncbi:MAG: ROK family protein [Arthrobacter sp.]|jgi:predicted NBD/HSP70 family sugar kinase|nr:ROK family protein [Arthrobacter sp.]
MRLGIDIGGTKTAVAAVAPNGSVLAHRSAPSGRGPAEVTRVAARLARETVAAAGVPADAVGACMPGMVDPHSGVVRHAVNLDVDELDLAAGLAWELHLPVSVDNDVKAAALGAALHVGHSGTGGTLAYLNLGTGLAAAVVRDGRVLRGPDGAVGEIGHLPVGTGVPCQCGQVGCLETIASGSAVARVWRPALGQAADPFAAAAAGDADAALAADMLADGVAQALLLLAVSVGPDRVALGGGVAKAPGLAGAVRAAVARRAAASDFVASLRLDSRFEVLPAEVPVASLGASLLPTR